MTAWKDDKKWSDKFLPEIKQIIGLYFISEIEEEDVHRNTDLIVIEIKPIRFACRVRKYKYLLHYGKEFTIRNLRNSGTKSELAKVIEGFGDYIFYGFSNIDESKLEQWFIGDLKVFRLWLAECLVKNKGEINSIKKQNTDNSSTFLSFKLSDLPKDFIKFHSNSFCVEENTIE